MRYFAIFFAWTGQANYGGGFRAMSSPEFPNCLKWLERYATEVGTPVKNVIMTGLFEFKNEQDFDSFRKGL